ncbi:MAG: TonB-dependent receptor [Kaiparowitsia implicata GSE-PSE-MK54-09C]|nr:TonB-dependent receptor [Kaiparowitsia implicata GSE-PSE-MK54-09C]
MVDARILWLSLGLAGVLGATATSAKAEAQPQVGLTSELVPHIAQTEPITIRGVTLVPDAAGLVIRLETSGDLAPVVSRQVLGNALILDIPNAVLALPDGDDYQASTPAEGIAFVTLTNQPDNQVRLAITGTTGVPIATLSGGPSELAIQITPGTASGEAAPEAAIQVVVTATRTEEDLADLPRSVTVITREEIEAQATLTRNLPDILGQLVPGLAPPTQSSSNLTQTLRGREPAVLIDGVPQLTNRRFFGELRTIDPASIERIEVVRGPSAVYGGGATGGVINIITRAPSDQPFTATTEIGFDAALNSAFLTSDSVGNVQQQTFSGRVDQLDYTLALGRSYSGLFYDAAGDRIPVESTVDISNASTLNGLGNLGFDIDDNQRLQLSVNYFRDRVGTEFLSDPIVNDIPGVQTSRVLEVPGRRFEGTRSPGSENWVTSLSYRHQDLLGSEVDAQLYYRDYTSFSIPFDQRGNANINALIRARLEQNVWGSRLGIAIPLGEAVGLFWGADYARESNSQFFETFDSDAFDASDERVFQLNGRLDEVPRYTLDNLGLFAQLQGDVSDRWLLSGGLRYENIGFGVGDYTTLEGVPITGGRLNFSDTVFNLGTAYGVDDHITLFANFAQGFSVPDLGRVIRDPDNLPTQTIAADLRLGQPQKVDNYEIGVRGAWDQIQVSLSGFFNYSALGSTLRSDPNNPLVVNIVRAPQRNYGLEATLDVQPFDDMRVGATLSWSDGENDEDGDGEFSPLSNRFISPLKLTTYVEHQATPGWRNRLQMLVSGSRDRSFDAGVDDGAIETYVVVDYISSVQLGPGTLNIGIQNLFNTQYSPVFFQWAAGQSGDFDSFGAAGRGRSLTLGYSYTW